MSILGLSVLKNVRCVEYVPLLKKSVSTLFRLLAQISLFTGSPIFRA